MLLVLLSLCIVAYANARCDFNLKIDRGEILRITSPNSPDPDTPGTECRWTVEAPVGIPMVVSCPFPKEPKQSINNDEEPQELSCDAEFFISPESDDKTRLCHGQPFSQTVNDAKLTMTYKVTGNVDKFTCYVHLREKNINEEPVDFGDCIENIYVQWGELKQLQSYHYPRRHPANKNCRWNVISPPDGRIRLRCPHNYFTPDPTTRDGCTFLSIYRAGVFDETEQNFHCRKIPHNIVDSLDNQMIITLTNNTEAVEPFRCFLTVTCDQNIKLEYDPENADKKWEIRSPRHPYHIPRRVSCRWSVESPNGTRILLTHPRGYYLQDAACPGSFRVYPDARVPLHFNPLILYCMDMEFQDYSYGNKMIIQFNFTEKDYVHDAFEFHLSLEKLEVYQDPLTSIDAVVYEPTELPCDISHDTSSPAVVIWYLTGRDKPVYTMDARVRGLFNATHWADKEFFGNRASLRVTEKVANLVIHEVLISDAGNYTCRVDFKRARSQNSNVILTVDPVPSPYRGCERYITVNFGETKLMQSLNQSGIHPADKKCRWTVKSPSNSRIELSCPLLYQQDTNLDPCANFLIYPTGAENGSHTLMQCNNEITKEYSEGNSMIITFSNLTVDFPAFACNLIATCNQTIHLDYSVRGFPIKSPGYPLMTPPGVSCRWTLDAPSQTRILVSCPNIDIPKDDPCRGWFIISTDGNVQFRFNSLMKTCRHKGFSQLSDTNMAILEYRNTDTNASSPFDCYLSVENALEGFGYGDIECSCGKRNSLRNVSPMFAGIIRPSESIPFCAGTIISPRYALTAASCMTDINVNEVDLIVGARNLQAIANDDPDILRYKITGIFNHPNWNGDKLSGSDVSLIYVNDIEFSRIIGPACLPFSNNNEEFADQNVTSLGWGDVERTKMLVLNDVACKSWYPSDFLSVNNTMFCTYAVQLNPCPANAAGSPLLWLDPVTNRWKLIGIQPGGWCNADNETRLVTRVTAFLPWIEENTPGVTYCRR